MRVNLNADLGEGYDDAPMFPLIGSANIACGFHAGDPALMARTIELAKTNGVSIGAHPSYADREGFGRRATPMSLGDVEAMVAYQIGSLMAVAALQGVPVTHVKPHGALNNLAAVDDDLALAIGRAIKAVDEKLIYLAPAGSAMVRAGHRLGLPMVEEVFADRAYDDDGNLVPRGDPAAMIHDASDAAERVLRMVKEGVLVSVSGKALPCRAQSICVHGDEPEAVAMAAHLRRTLEAHGISLVPLPRLL